MHTTLGDWLLEPVANAIEAGARAIQVEVARQGSIVAITVSDDGPGLDPTTMATLLDPLTGGDPRKHPSRRPHLGLPLLDQMVRQAGGHLTIDSAPGEGTVVRWTMDLAHPDTPPEGDWAAAATAAMVMAAGHGVALRWRRTSQGRSYEADNLGLLGCGGAVDASVIAQLRRDLDGLERRLAAASRPFAPAAHQEIKSWAS